MIQCDQFIEAVKQHMQPAGRAQHMAGMHQPLLAAVPADVALADWPLDGSSWRARTIRTSRHQ